MRYLSVCSGIEAASAAWHSLGWQPVAFSEIEPFPCSVLAHHFPNVPNFGDMNNFEEWDIEPGSVDVLVGGTPCQSFSIAGLRGGLKDGRGNLALTYCRIVQKLQPKWFVWENVPGVLSSNSGRDFGSIVGAMAELGYGIAYRVLDAQYFGVPQRRRRVFVVACLGDWRAPAEVLSLREGLLGHIASGGKKRKSVAPDAGAGFEAGGILWNGSDQANAERVVNKAGTLNCDQGQRGGYICSISHWDGGPHPTLNRGGQGQIGYSNQEIFSQGGCGLVPGQPIPYRKAKLAQSTTDDETWVEGQVSNTLNNFDLGDTRTTHAVVEPLAWTQNQREEVRLLGDKVGAIALPGTHQTNYIAEPIAIQGTIIGRGENAGPQGTGATEGGPMFTLTKTDIHGVAHTMPGTVAPTIGASGPPYSRTGNERVEAEALAVTFQPGNLRREAGADPSFTTTTTLKASAGDQTPHVAYPMDMRHICKDTKHDANRTEGFGLGENGDPAHTLTSAMPHGVATSMAVRRLTPVECERLQGFPDNWSRISWKGKPETDCPDGPRYKACGNSMAVPVMRWIGEQIKAYESNRQ